MKYLIFGTLAPAMIYGGNFIGSVAADTMQTIALAGIGGGILCGLTAWSIIRFCRL